MKVFLKNFGIVPNQVLIIINNKKITWQLSNHAFLEAQPFNIIQISPLDAFSHNKW
jgi:hypothetical protein